MPDGITHSYLLLGTSALTTAVSGQYSICPPIKDERPSRPEPTQANDLPRVATISHHIIAEFIVCLLQQQEHRCIT